MGQDASNVEALVVSAASQPWLPAAERQRGPVLDRASIELLVPHREPFLFIDRITWVDRDDSVIVCQHDLHATLPVFAGHFPQHPIWPGVLQVEAIGQAGFCLHQLTSARTTGGDGLGLALTHILAARFIRPVRPGTPVELVVRAFVDGLFTVLVGQCLQHDAVCSVAAMQGIYKEAGQ